MRQIMSTQNLTTEQVFKKIATLKYLQLEEPSHNGDKSTKHLP